MNKSISLLLVFISFVLYFSAPMSYSWSYCAVCAGVYIANAVIGLMSSFRNEPLSFGLFFSLAIFCCSYVFPLVIYPLDENYSLFQFGYNPTVITKCTALTCLAHSLYWFGVTNAKKRHYKYLLIKKLTIDDRMIEIISFFVVFLFIGFLLLGGLSYYTDRYLEGNMSTNLGFQYLNVLFSTLAVTFSCMLLYADKTSTYLKDCVILGIISIVILSTGSRTLPMYLIIPMAYVYQKRYNVGTIKLAALCFIMLFVFVAIGRLRSEGINVEAISSYSGTSSEFGYWDNMLDFIVCNRNLYDIYSAVDNEGILWGKNFLGSLLSVIPFAQSLVSSLFNIPSYQLDSAYFCTYKVFGENAPLGLGTHVVGDVYLAFGLIGVIVLFYMLGYFITKLRNGILFTGSHFMYIAYLYMLSYSVFFCRGSFFGAFKGIIWSALVLYLVNKNIAKK